MQLTWDNIDKLVAGKELRVDTANEHGDASSSASTPRPSDSIRSSNCTGSQRLTLTLPRLTAPLSSSPEALTIVCVKWGTLYGAEYANKLSRGVRRALGPSLVRCVVCFTDDAQGLDEDIDVRPLGAKNCGWKGWWHKAHIFSSAADLHGRVLYLDLDTVIVDGVSLAPLAAYTGSFATLSTRDFDAEEGYTDGYNTSAMLWNADGIVGEALRALHTKLRAEVFMCLMRWDHWVEMLVQDADLLQDVFPTLFADYRQHCRQSGPPDGAAIICFPRNPKPHEVEDDWVRRYWR